MLGIATLRAGGAKSSRPLWIMRALVIVLVVLDLGDTLLRPSPLLDWWVHPLAIASATAAVIALFRPAIGVAVALVPIGSTLVVGARGQDILPLAVTTLVMCAAASAWLVAVTLLLYLGYCAAIWVADDGATARALSCLVLVALFALVGFVVRAVAVQARRLDHSIDRVRARTVRLRADERASLAEELSQLLSEALEHQRRRFADVRASRDPVELRGVLSGAEANAVETLAQLRGLVSTLRGRDEEPHDPERPAGAELLGVVDEIEELLVANGHPVEVDVPAEFDDAGDLVPRLFGRILCEAGPLMARQSVPGGGCLIALRVSRDEVGLELGHVGEPDGPLPAALRAEGERLLAAGGSFEVGVQAGSWRLRAAMPLRTVEVADAPVVPEHPRPAWTGSRLRLVAALVLAVAAVAALVQTALEWVGGAPGASWWALWALTLAGSAGAVWLASVRLVVTLVAVPLLSVWTIDPTPEIGQPNQVAIMVLMAIAVIRDSRWAWAALAFWIFCCLLWVGALDPAFSALQLLHPMMGLIAGLAVALFLRLRVTQNDLLLAATATHDGAQGEVRRELAGELHDIVAHQLSLITMHAGAHRNDAKLDALRAALDQVATITRSAQADLAVLLHVMRASPPASATADVGWLAPAQAAQAAAATLRDAGHEVRLEVDPEIDAADPTTRKTLSRIVREATTNLLRYASPGAGCLILIRREGQQVRLEITNPMPVQARRSVHSTGLGLIGLDERVRITGGRFTASASQNVWRVIATLPITPAVDLRPPEFEATLSR